METQRTPEKQGVGFPMQFFSWVGWQCHTAKRWELDFESGFHDVLLLGYWFVCAGLTKTV